MTESGHGYATDDDGGSRLGELVQWAMGHMGHIGAWGMLTVQSRGNSVEC